MTFIQFISQPWPWYVAGPIIGLMVPLLLLLGNKSFGISSSLRHVCAACIPANISFFKYDWKKEIWNLFFASGIILGGFIAAYLLTNHQPVDINPKLVSELQSYGITTSESLLPTSLFNWSSLLTIKGFSLMVIGGLSSLQLPSLIATVCFMAGGFIMANLILPHILKLI